MMLIRESTLPAALLLALTASAAAAEKAPAPAPLVTPVGIELQPLGHGQGLATGTINFGAIPPFDTAYADHRGMTLYTYDKDSPGKSACMDACAAEWHPASPLAGAKASGDWTIIQRDDGARQWALKGKPLYTYVKDLNPGSVAGTDPAPKEGARLVRGAPAAGNKVPDNWHVALFWRSDNTPGMQAVDIPHGLAMQDVADAGGVGLVNSEGRTLYTYTGSSSGKDSCAVRDCTPWVPVEAPQLANAVGDFSFVLRDDGVKQWVYKGAPLYRFEGDLATGYANGDGADPRFHVALVMRYPTPGEINIQPTAGRGKVLAAKSGLTLYRRDAVSYHTGGGHSFRHGVYYRPGIGRDIGQKGCTDLCTETWHPLLASPGAQPSGYWEIQDHPDGSRQWAYRGYPLYTYSGDRKRGDMNGNDLYDIVLSDDGSKEVARVAGTPGIGGMYWLIAEP